MPLLVITGYPSSGKTTRAEQIKDDLVRRIEESKEGLVRKLKVHIVNDHILKIPKDVYRDAKLEKAARGSLISSTSRLLTKDDIVICDGLNYIKGFRYQLHCESKALETPHCVVRLLHRSITKLEVHVGVPKETCAEWNRSRGDKGYPEDMHVLSRKKLIYRFNDLIMRYEEPNPAVRWDSPLFTVLHIDDHPPYDALWNALVYAKVKPQNAATVLVCCLLEKCLTISKPAAETDYLYELEKTSQEIVDLIVEQQAINAGEVSVDGMIIRLPVSNIPLPQLQRYRRQFVSLNRMHSFEKKRIKELFVDFLNTLFE